MATQLTEWRPFSDFAELRHRLDQAFHEQKVEIKPKSDWLGRFLPPEDPRLDRIKTILG